jgi:RNAse (barnase) inhibitor barstar
MRILVPNSISKKEELLHFLATQLKFPNYFGFNWDALFDCLKDLYWITEVNIVLEHEKDFKLIGLDDKIYREIMHDIEIFWNEFPEHKFEVIYY